MSLPDPWPDARFPPPPPPLTKAEQAAYRPQPQRGPSGWLIAAIVIGSVLVILGGIGFFVWKIVDATAPLRVAGTAFFQHLSTGDTESIYPVTTDGFRRDVPPLRLIEFARTYRLDRPVGVSWTSTQITNSDGRVRGTLTREDRSTAAAEVVFVWSNQRWLIVDAGVDGERVAGGRR
jgi:hypothetical protein